MANTSAVYVRIDTGLKENAESILSQLGITPSGAISMLYHQIVLTKSLPLTLKLPQEAPTSVSQMSREELDRELTLGVNSLNTGKRRTASEVDAVLSEEFGI